MELISRGGIFIWALLALALIAGYALVERALYFLGEHRRRLKGLLGSPPGSLSERQALELMAAARAKLWLLSSTGRIAPLVGLLGTISGLMHTFQEIERAGGRTGVSQLAGGVWEALITTAVGLGIAIPALMAYDYFSRLLERLAGELESVLSDE